MKKIVLIIIPIIAMFACKQVYTPPVNLPTTGYLVVEGLINSSSKAVSTIQLTHTTKLVDSTNIIYENNARVTIEGEANDIYLLNITTNGVYKSDSISLNSNEKYHLRIKTEDGKEYLSDYSAIRSTPDIDSITWKRDDNGVGIYVNTHDAQNITKYYQWKYEETWEFHSPNYSSLKYIYDPVTGQISQIVYRNIWHLVDTTIYKCWQTVSSSAITLGTTDKLSQDLIYLSFINIEPGSQKLTVLYSVNLKQYALSKEAYQFYQTLKKNTEELGSIFAVQPSEIQGNIHCISNSNEPVIGFVEVSEEKQQRIFISNDQVPGWSNKVPCPTIVIDANIDSIRKAGIDYLPTVPEKVGIGLETFFATNDARCIDCTLSGTNVRPVFWP